MLGLLEWWLTYGGTEIANSARLAAYLDSPELAPPNLTSIEDCGCPTLTAQVLGHGNYVSPEADPAPWWDPQVPESADFYGLLVLSVDGLDDRPTQRAVTSGITGVAAIGRSRPRPRVLAVTAVLVGASCCGVDWGLQWLGEVLDGCGEGQCRGHDLELGSCCPPEEPASLEEFRQQYGRVLRRVVLTQGPTVISRHGDGCTSGGNCASGADAVVVEFVLTATVPWQWATPVPVLETGWPRSPDTECVEWCVHDPGQGSDCGTCRLAACTDPQAACRDPGCLTPSPPTPPQPAGCWCEPLAVETECHDLDVTDRPGCFPAAPVITVEAGSEPLRRAQIVIYQRQEGDEGLSCEDLAELHRCNPHSVYSIGWVPAGGRLILDGQVGRATVECDGTVETSTDVWGAAGGPISWEPLRPGTYCVCLATDAIVPPAADATITISLSGRER